jgi:hypothetical protein
MSPLSHFEVEDLKLVYRTLHGQALSQPALMDSGLLHEIQRYLQLLARAEGVDLSDHARWDGWLDRPAAQRPPRSRGATRRETD